MHLEEATHPCWRVSARRSDLTLKLYQDGEVAVNQKKNGAEGEGMSREEYPGQKK